MSARPLPVKYVEKPWGRTELWPGFTPPGAEPVGEVWFDAGDDPALLVKYLFTSERLSIQVHPDDVAAQAAGHRRGKDEAWVILAAEPGATIALGPKAVTSREAMEAAALDGTLADLLDWRVVAAGDVIYSPSGTVHAIGAGLTLIEVQQNSDLTYRLFDYGRPRPLHLAAGIAVSDPVPFVAPPIPGDAAPGRRILAEGGRFVLEEWRWTGERQVALSADRPGWFVMVEGTGAVDGVKVEAGSCWLADAPTRFALEPGARALLAYPPGERVTLA